MLAGFAHWKRLLPLLGVLGLLASYGIGRPPLGTAEKIFLEAAPSVVLELFGNEDHPLYLTVLHYWIEMSRDRTWLRLANVFTALVVLVAAERTLPLLGGNHAAGGALILLAVAPLLVSEIRQLGPSPVGLLSILLCLRCFLEYLRAGELSWLAGWMASALAGVLVETHLSYQIVLYNSVMVFYRKRIHNKQRRWWLLQIPLLAISALHAFPSFSQLTTLAAKCTTAETHSVASDLFARLTTGRPLDRPVAEFGALFFLLLLICGLWGCRDLRRDTRHGLLLLSSLTPGLLAYLIPQAHSLLLAALPGTTTIVSIGLRQLPRWLRQICWSVIVCNHFVLYRGFLVLADLEL